MPSTRKRLCFHIRLVASAIMRIIDGGKRNEDPYLDVGRRRKTGTWPAEPRMRSPPSP